MGDPEMPQRKGTIESLQAGRGVAAFAVVLYHAGLAARDFAGQREAYDLLRLGYLGVDFFFVLSGFIIYHSTVGRRRSLRDYAVARFRRVYLPYYPIGLAMALFYALLPKDVHVWSWLSTLTLAPIDTRPALAVAWTLQHEVLFYLLFGLFYFSGTLALGLLAWGACILFLGTHLPFADVNLEFFFGIAIAIFYRRGDIPRWILIFAPLFFIIWIWRGADEAHRVWFGAAVACLVAWLAQAERTGLKVPASLVLLGAASYSLYLVHDPVISITARVVPGSLLIISAVAASLLAGFAYHFSVEKWAVARKANPEVFRDSLAALSKAYK